MGIGRDAKRLLAVSRLGDAVFRWLGRPGRRDRRRLRRKQRRLARSSSVRLEAEEDSERDGDGDGQQRSVDEDSDRHGCDFGTKNRRNERLDRKPAEEQASERRRWSQQRRREKRSDGFVWRVEGKRLEFEERGPGQRYEAGPASEVRGGTRPAGTGCRACLCTRYKAGTSGQLQPVSIDRIELRPCYSSTSAAGFSALAALFSAGRASDSAVPGGETVLLPTYLLRTTSSSIEGSFVWALGTKGAPPQENGRFSARCSSNIR